MKLYSTEKHLEIGICVYKLSGVDLHFLGWCSMPDVLSERELLLTFGLTSFIFAPFVDGIWKILSTFFKRNERNGYSYIGLERLDLITIYEN